MDHKPLKYDMVSHYEQRILTRRPLKKSTVTGLLKGSLRNFLHGNNISLPPASTNKSVLADMVMDLISSEDSTTLTVSTPEIKDMDHVEQLSLPPGNTSMSVPNFSTAPQQTDNNTPPAASDAWDNLIDISYIDTIQPATVIQQPATVTLQPSADQPAAVIETPLILNPCNAIYIAQEYQPIHDGDWDMPPACNCHVTLNDLTRHLILPKSSMELLEKMINGTIEELVIFLSMYGEPGAGCRVQLLMQLRDLLEGEANVTPTISVPASISTSTATQISAVTNPSDLNLKRKYEKDPGPSSSNVKSKVMKISMTSPNTDMKPKKFMYGQETMYKSLIKKKPKAIEDTPLAHMLGVGSSHFAVPGVPGTSRVAIKRNIPAALGAPLNADGRQKQAITAQQTQKLSQDFGKMMAQQVSQAWIQHGTAQPNTSTFVVAAVGTSAASTSTLAPQLAATLNASPEKDPEKECCICILNDRSIAFIPCGHAVCCSDCAPQMKDCPVCRKKITSRLTLYFS